MTTCWRSCASPPARLVPHYNLHVKNVEVGDSGDYPVTVTLQRMEPDRQGQEETVRARYVVGCDGARSSVRQSIGRSLVGDVANQAWGVMDVLAVTDFPDIRLKSVIHSANEGNILIIPREGGYLVRFYIELDKLNPDQHLTTKDITTDQLIAAANRIIHPYTLDVKDIAWWSVYEIGQRLCDKFDDVPQEEMKSRFPRVFIAGDACHTHSAKAGQGMNVSMQDTFNLGWKLAAVLQGKSSPTLLHTYSAERQAIAKQLIDFDREFAKRPVRAPSTDAAARGRRSIAPAIRGSMTVRPWTTCISAESRFCSLTSLNRQAEAPALRRIFTHGHLLRVGGQDHDRDLRVALLDAVADRRRRQVRKAQVQQQHVGPELLAAQDRLGPGARVAHQLEEAAAGEQQPHSGQDDGVIVGHDHGVGHPAHLTRGG